MGVFRRGVRRIWALGKRAKLDREIEDELREHMRMRVDADVAKGMSPEEAMRRARLRFGNVWGVLLIPFLWTGLEYFRSELYYLRFSWFNVGYAFSSSPNSVPLNQLGMYGIAFLLMAAFAAIELMPKQRRMIASGEALLRLEEALVPFGEGPQLRWNRHGSQDRAFCMVGPARKPASLHRLCRYASLW